MEEYITRADADRLIKEEVSRQLREQKTEEIPAFNVNVGSKDVLDQLQEIEQKQDKIAADVEELKIDAKAYTSDAAIFKNKVERIESDVSTIKTDVDTLKTVQSGHSKYFEEHGRRLASMATKEDLATMATKDDISRLETDITEIKGLLQQLLQQRSSE